MTPGRKEPSLSTFPQVVDVDGIPADDGQGAGQDEGAGPLDHVAFLSDVAAAGPVSVFGCTIADMTSASLNSSRIVERLGRTAPLRVAAGRACRRPKCPRSATRLGRSSAGE
jgi:hypothetical protein